MYEVEITRSFSAAHQLRGYNGDCKNLHGHNYRVTVTARSAKLNEVGIALDFRLLKKTVDELLAEYDHRNLSELPEFSSENPTSENLARSIFDKLAAPLAAAGAELCRVRVGESENSAVTYFPGE